MTLGITVLRAALATLAAVSLWTASHAKADPVQYLLVPSAAMGRHIPVAFQAGGPHAVVLLDAFDAALQISNWVTAGGAMISLAGSGVSVVAPAGRGLESLHRLGTRQPPMGDPLVHRTSQLAGR